MSFVEQVAEAIRKCEQAVKMDDDEAAHVHEDEALKTALKAALNGEANWQILAKQALDLGDLNFSRWFS